MAQQDKTVTVTLAGIARLAGVGRAAVSNWRRRHDDFPSPVGGTDASPQFSLDMIEEWLRRHGKGGNPVGGWERLWPRIEDLGDRDRMGLVIASVGFRLSGAVAPAGLTASGLTDQERVLVDEALRLAQHEDGEGGFRFLLGRWLGTHVRQIATTPTPLADLMVEVAQEVRGGDDVRLVVDPACGTGGLLVAAVRRWAADGAMKLAGNDTDPALAHLAAARLALEVDGANHEVLVADTLREDPLKHADADVVLCNPPANERDWGHAELATDQRWRFGQPPRTESELAWVQHILSLLGPDGAAVVLLPPAVASRRAGRRIRAGLVRAGAVRMVAALPAGAAQPYGVGLHLWVLCSPAGKRSSASVLFVDAAECRHTPSSGRGQTVDWDSVRDRLLGGLKGGTPEGTTLVPQLNLLGDETDLTPARQLPATAAATAADLRRSWAAFDAALLALRDSSQALRALTAVRDPGDRRDVSVAELEQTGAVTLAVGASLPAEMVRRGPRPDDAVPVLTPLMVGDAQTEQQWMTSEDAELLHQQGKVTLTAFGDVVVVGAAQGYDAWVETKGTAVLGPHLHRLRVDPERLDPFFLVACLRVRSNARRAGTHASLSSRIDVRRLRALRLPLDEQRRLGEVHRQLVEFEESTSELGSVGQALREVLTGLLAGGALAVE
ncbi:N-6 DNA methylase [Streptomyces sp. V17-9]|uniref:HsdM family class I SAM-dependent methyltransferase n=1 Tax=Streptomyces sp. V17-9 TaxID=2831149 RepID=UPI001BB08D18|nr:N-6 DNA methylase [Streptomyces sp. V17-9]QUW94412.1 putative type I restriction enzymeP M protein [Streptomyces sp. V17-9]